MLMKWAKTIYLMTNVSVCVLCEKSWIVTSAMFKMTSPIQFDILRKNEKYTIHFVTSNKNGVSWVKIEKRYDRQNDQVDCAQYGKK